MQRKRREIVKDRRGVRRRVMGGKREWACSNRISLPFKRHFQAVILISH